MSLLRTAALLGLLTGLFLVIGYFLAGTLGMLLFLGIACATNFFVYWYSDKIVLSMYRAKPMERDAYPWLHARVERLCKQAKIPVPRLYLLHSAAPNAFATGRNPKCSAVVVTTGLLEKLNSEEVEAVISHELAHIKSRDTLTSTIAAMVAGAIAYIAQVAWFGAMAGERRDGLILLPLLILAPVAATLVQLAISRTREYAADRNGALLCRKPLSLASALEKISSDPRLHSIEGNPATSHLFIVNPFRPDSLTNLFSTHPPITERIKRLRQLA